jgi:serine/threonine protein kinase
LIHRDIKPDNFLLGITEQHNKHLFLIDFGLCKTYLQDGLHIEMKQTTNLIGSLTYASIIAHLHLELSRRDDLESLCYMLIYLYQGGLSWQKEPNERDIIEQKTNIINDEKLPNILKELLIYVRNLQFKESLNYDFYVNAFEMEIERL